MNVAPADRNRWIQPAARGEFVQERRRCTLCNISFTGVNQSRHIHSRRHRRLEQIATRRELAGQDPLLPLQEDLDRFFVTVPRRSADRRKFKFCRICGLTMITSNVRRHTQTDKHRRIVNRIEWYENRGYQVILLDPPDEPLPQQQPAAPVAQQQQQPEQPPRNVLGRAIQFLMRN